MTSVIVLCIILAILILLSVPIGASLGFATLLIMAIYTSNPLTAVIQYVVNSLNSFALMAVPFFICAGGLMAVGGISRRICSFFDVLVGKFTGGLGIVTTLSSMFFAAISGSGPATVSAIGGMMYPDMVKRGYDPAYTAALMATAGTIGVIIPPSVPFVLYGVATNTSVGDLFLAGFIPGILIGIGLIIVNYFTSKKHGYRGEEDRGSVSLWKTFKDAFWALLSPVIILGGIYSGIFTPTEAAVVSIVYSFVVSKFIYKELSWKAAMESVKDTVSQSGMIGLAMSLSSAFAAYLAMEQVPAKLSNILTSAFSSDVILMLVLILILLVVGCFIDNISACLILAPVMLPIAEAIGYDPVHFGIIMTIALAIGFVTPPFGVNLFVASAMSGLAPEAVAKKSWWLLGSMLVVLLLVTFIEPISMALVWWM